jgi:hypothetical protein
MIDHAEVVDGCGVAPADDPGAFVVTGGRGEVLRAEPGQGGCAPLPISAASVAAWDNHLVMALSANS